MSAPRVAGDGPRRLHPLLGVVLGLAAAMFDARAEETRHAWALRESREDLVLAWEVPETSDQPLMLHCRPGSGRVAIRLVPRREEYHAGEVVPVEVSAGGASLSLRLRAEESELNGVDLAGDAGSVARLAPLLSAPGRLTLRSARDAWSVPLVAGVDERTRFLGRCR